MPFDVGALRAANALLSNSKPKRNAFMSGVSSGVDDLEGLLYSAGGAVADTAGATDTRDWFNDQSDRKQRDSQRNGRDDLSNIEDQTLSSMPGYIAYQVGKQVPNLAGAIGAGMLAPEVAAPAGLSRAAAVLPKFFGGGGMAGEVAAATAKGTSEFAARRAALEAGKSMGKMVVGGGAFNYAQGVGSLYQESVDAGNPDAGPRSLLEGVPYAVTETLPEAMMVGRIGHGSGFKGGMLTRMGKAGASQAATGATSEILQNEMEMGMHPDGQISSDEANSRRLNSGVAGGLVEGLLGSAGGVRSHTPRNILNGTDVVPAMQDPTAQTTAIDMPAPTPEQEAQAQQAALAKQAADAAKAQIDARKAASEAETDRITALGVPAKGARHFIFQQVEQLLAAGHITPEQYDSAHGNLMNAKDGNAPNVVQKFVDGVKKNITDTQKAADKTAADAKKVADKAAAEAKKLQDKADLEKATVAANTADTANTTAAADKAQVAANIAALNARAAAEGPQPNTIAEELDAITRNNPPSDSIQVVNDDGTRTSVGDLQTGTTQATTNTNAAVPSGSNGTVAPATVLPGTTGGNGTGNASAPAVSNGGSNAVKPKNVVNVGPQKGKGELTTIPFGRVMARDAKGNLMHDDNGNLIPTNETQHIQAKSLHITRLKRVLGLDDEGRMSNAPMTYDEVAAAEGLTGDNVRSTIQNSMSLFNLSKKEVDKILAGNGADDMQKLAVGDSTDNEHAATAESKSDRTNEDAGGTVLGSDERDYNEGMHGGAVDAMLTQTGAADRGSEGTGFRVAGSLASAAKGDKLMADDRYGSKVATGTGQKLLVTAEDIEARIKAERMLDVMGRRQERVAARTKLTSEEHTKLEAETAALEKKNAAAILENDRIAALEDAERNRTSDAVTLRMEQDARNEWNGNLDDHEAEQLDWAKLPASIRSDFMELYDKYDSGEMNSREYHERHDDHIENARADATARLDSKRSTGKNNVGGSTDAVRQDNASNRSDGTSTQGQGGSTESAGVTAPAAVSSEGVPATPKAAPTVTTKKLRRVPAPAAKTTTPLVSEAELPKTDGPIAVSIQAANGNTVTFPDAEAQVAKLESVIKRLEAFAKCVRTAA